MDKVVVFETLRSQLGGLASDAEFCDEGGQTLGFFVPRSSADREAYRAVRTLFTDAEIEAARGESGGYSLAQILDELSE